MPECGPVQNLITILQTCRKEKNLDHARQLHACILNKGPDTYKAVGNYMVPMFVECGSVCEAQHVFEMLDHHNEHSWNSLILGYAQSGKLLHAMSLYDEMQQVHIPPAHYTFVGLLKACATLQDMEKGFQIHAEIVQRGVQIDLVGNTLVSMYAKCGLLLEALRTFDKLAVRTIVSWTALIACYLEHGLGEDALKCFQELKQDCFFPNAVTFLCALKACGIIGAIHKGHEIHREIVYLGLENELLVYNTLISMYAKCESLTDARQVFNKLQVRDLVTWTALITGYSECGPEQEALVVFEQMQQEGAPLDAVILLCVLKVCTNLVSLDNGQRIHGIVAEEGLEEDTCLGNCLIGLYAKCGAVLEACDILDNLPDRNVVSWAALITGYVEHGCFWVALICFERMQVEGFVPNDAIFVCALKSCGCLGNLESGRSIHSQVLGKGFEKDLLIGSALIDLYARCGFVLEAQMIFDRLPVRNVVTWTALIGGYAEHGPYDVAVKLFEKMRAQGLSPSNVTFSCVLKGCGSMGAIDTGQELHLEITKKGFEGNPLIANSLITMYMKCGSISTATKVFKTMSDRNVVAWSSMIQGYGLNHASHMALECFEKMQQQGVKPNGITFLCLLTACCQSSLVSMGQFYFNKMKEDYGIMPKLEHHACMVDLLSRSGFMHEAERILGTLSSPTERMWAALFSACRTHTKLDMGVRCFQQLVHRSSNDAAWYVLMAEIYSSTRRWRCVPSRGDEQGSRRSL